VIGVTNLLGRLHGARQELRPLLRLPDLFMFFMLLLVLGAAVVLFVGWEGVGLASYLADRLLVRRPGQRTRRQEGHSSRTALATPLLLGMFVLYQAFGTLTLDRINAALRHRRRLPWWPASLWVEHPADSRANGPASRRKFPLHVRLPDARPGPDAVSAFDHAATMVTAGV